MLEAAAEVVFAQPPLARLGLASSRSYAQWPSQWPGPASGDHPPGPLYRRYAPSSTRGTPAAVTDGGDGGRYILRK